jgi:putative ABC transport system substrate-binding protein
MVATAKKRKLPISVANIGAIKNHAILTSYGMDTFLTGKQAARLADQILKGSKPDNLPVETAEFYLAINLKTAKTIGLTISDEILRHAHLVVR